MSAEENKRIIHRIFEEGMNQNKPEVFDEVVAPDYVNHDFPTASPGVAGFKEIDAQFRTAFPDMKITIKDTVAEGNKVVTRGVFTGTHQGDFMGIPSTGKSIKVSYIDIWTVVNGKGHENWVQLDMLGLMQQLGVVPAPGQSSG